MVLRENSIEQHKIKLRSRIEYGAAWLVGIVLFAMFVHETFLKGPTPPTFNPVITRNAEIHETKYKRNGHDWLHISVAYQGGQSYSLHVVHDPSCMCRK